MKKQSSIEWLEDGVSIAIENTSENSINYILEKLFQQAKEIHKQEIVEAHCDWKRIIDKLPSRSADEYYKNTYEKEN